MNTSKNSTPKLILLYIAFFFSAELLALETNVAGFRINGFGTVGLIKNSDEYIGFRNTINQQGVFDEYDLGLNSLLGIQVNYSATDKLDFGIQLLAKHRNKNSLDKSIQWAYLNYKISPEIDIKIGRVGVDNFMMSDFRHVGFARLWTHLPTEFYAFHSTNAVDGVNIVFKQSMFGGLLRYKAWFGQATFESYHQDVSDIDFEQLFGTSVTWENGTWNLRANYSQTNTGLKNDTLKSVEQGLQAASRAGWPVAANFSDLTIDGKIIRYYAAGIGYDKADWLIQSEVSVINTDSLLVPGWVSGYFSIGRKLGSVTPFIVGSWTKATEDRLVIPTPSIEAYIPLQQLSQSIFNQFYTAQHTFSFGARWDIQPKVSLKAQWDKTWIDEYGGYLLATPNRAVAEKKQLDVFSLSIDFLF